MPKLVEMVLIGMDILFNVVATGESPLISLWHSLTYLILALIVRKLRMAHVAVSRFSLSPNKWLILIRIIVESGTLYILAHLTVLVSESFGNVVVCFSSAAGPILVSCRLYEQQRN